MRKLAAVAALLLIAPVAFAQTGKAKLVEKVTKKGNELVIPYERYVLPNGLTVIVHEDHSDPIVHVDVTYHVGSAREQEGRSGFAHFFEHMMFQGSDNVADEEHFKIVTESGGQLNGTTNTDRTNYFETLPSNQLEIGLWLEADRMGFLLDAVTQEKFEIQRATVKNERGQNYDNRPYGLMGEKVGEALYPVGHPYSWTTIGYVEDLDRVNVQDLKNFFMRWYGPNNAVLTVAGDVKPEEVIKMVEKYFGPIPRGPEVKPQPKTPVTLDKDRYISYEDNIRFPVVQLSFPSVPNRHPDEAPLDVLAEIIGGGKNSIMYKNFVKSQLAIQAGAMNPAQELSGVFQLSVFAYPGKSLAEMETLIRNSIAEFEKRGVTEDDLKKYKSNYESQTIQSLSSVSGKASQLAAYYTFTGDANYIKKDMERYLKVTKEDVMRVYNQYIKNKPAVILSVVPKGKPELKAKPDTWVMPKRNVDNPEAAEYKNLSYTKPKDSFDRSKRPGSGSNPVVKVPDYWTETFNNGLKVIGAKNDEVPSVTLMLSIEAGHRYESKDKAGIAQTTADMLNESTLMHSAEEISDELDKLGSSIDVSAGSNEITITVNSLVKNLDQTLRLFEEILLYPKFDSTEFENAKMQQIEAIANQVTQPVAIANNVFSKLMYGPGHIMSIPTLGTAETVKKFTLADVKEYYKTNFSPSISQVVIVGDVKKEAIMPKLEFLKNWTDRKIVRQPEPGTPNVGNTKIYMVNKDKAPQSEIRIGYMSMPYDATGEFYKAQLMNYVLGGAFNSRINLNLREARGFTYGASSGFKGNRYPGPFMANAGVRDNATDSSVVEFMKEIKKYAQTGIMAPELDFVKASIGQSEALKYESSWQKAFFLKKILDYKLDKTFVEKQNEILKNITVDEINALAKKLLPFEQMAIVVVGDKASIYEKLLKTGYEVVELDTEGNVIPKKEEPKKEEPKITENAPPEIKKDDKRKKKK
jgi:zinc protease